MNLARKVLGPPKLVEMLTPYAEWALEQVMALAGRADIEGLSDRMAEQSKRLVPIIVQFIVGKGFKPFIMKLMGLLELKDLGSLEKAWGLFTSAIEA